MLSLSVQEVLQPQQCTAYGNKKKRKEQKRKQTNNMKYHHVSRIWYQKVS